VDSVPDGLYCTVFVSCLQALGLEVRSVLAIGGIGGLAIGLAGREICENLLNGFLLMTTVSSCFWVMGSRQSVVLLHVGAMRSCWW
jgi:hypothetical protein